MAFTLKSGFPKTFKEMGATPYLDKGHMDPETAHTHKGAGDAKKRNDTVQDYEGVEYEGDIKQNLGGGVTVTDETRIGGDKEIHVPKVGDHDFVKGSSTKVTQGDKKLRDMTNIRNVDGVEVTPDTKEFTSRKHDEQANELQRSISRTEKNDPTTRGSITSVLGGLEHYGTSDAQHADTDTYEQELFKNKVVEGMNKSTVATEEEARIRQPGSDWVGQAKWDITEDEASARELVAKTSQTISENEDDRYGGGTSPKKFKLRSKKGKFNFGK